MGSDTNIEWTDATWNPVRGCSRVSPGCENCYAERVAARFSDRGLPYEGLARRGKNGPRWTGKLRIVEEHLADPLRWTKPRRVFVNSMSDLFHPELSNEQIAAVFGVMASSSRHTFQVLTKRADRMADWFAWLDLETEGSGPSPWRFADLCQRAALDLGVKEVLHPIKGTLRSWPWPLPNVWIGVSVEDQKRAEERIPHLLAVPAAVRFLSCEPLLGEVSLWAFLKSELRDQSLVALGATPMPGVDWVIVGGESGPGARRFDAAWARSIVHQCREADVPVFVKQMGAQVVDRNDRFDTAGDSDDPRDWPWSHRDPTDVEHDIRGFREEHQGAPVRIRLLDRKGGNPAEWPPDLRVREFPEVRS